MRFFQFGCWNNLNQKKGNLKGVMAKLKTTIETSRPEFIVVSGDNYYPGKETFNGEKKKTIDFDKLREGFSELPSDIDIHMLLGNHDLETQTQKPNLFIKDGREEDGTCEILRKEKCIVDDKRNIHYNSFRSIVEGDTLILMIDTSMYEEDEDVKKYLPCYNVFFTPRQQIMNVNQLRNYQLKQITEILDKIKTDKKDIKHIILIGHHPIYSYKTKEKDGKKKSTVDSDIIHHFIDVLKKIYNKVNNPDCKYYYLCSDLHLYQEGTIQLTVNRLGKNKMEIKQYIVGNGGTELDLKSDYTSTDNIHTIEGKHTYVCSREEEKHGFLQCDIAPDGPTLTPHFVEGTSGGKKRKTKRKTQRRNHISSISRRTAHVQ